MDLPLDPTLPLGGIALILTLVWLTGGRRTAAIATAQDAVAALAAPETGFHPAEIAVSTTGDAALARDAAGHVAVVFVSGARLIARRLGRDDIAGVTAMLQDNASVLLSIETRAFTRPRFALKLDAAAAAVWQRHLQEAA